MKAFNDKSWELAFELLKDFSQFNHLVSPLILKFIFTNEASIKELNRIKNETELLVFFEKQKDTFVKTNAAPVLPLKQELIRSSLREFYQWMESGFNIVNEDRYSKRLQICQTCPFIKNDDFDLLYKLADTITGKSPICLKCGCQIRKKARLASSNCPIENPLKLKFSLWGEPI